MLFDPALVYEELIGSKEIAIDIETTGLSPYKDNIAVIAMYSEGKETCIIQTPNGVIPYPVFKLVENSKNTTWITHNGSGFDLLFFLNCGMVIPYNQHYDTLIGEQVLSTHGRRDVSKKLSDTMKRRIGKSFKQEIDHETWKRKKLSIEQLKYVAGDVEYLHKIKRIQEKLCKERNLFTALENEQLLTTITAGIAYNGLPISIPLLSQYKEELAKDAEKSLEIFSILDPEINVSSHKKVKEMLDFYGINVSDTAKTTLLPMGNTNPICKNIINVREYLRGKNVYDEEWVTKFVDSGRVRCNYWQLGANTTRYTSSNPNMQQIPQKMRKVFGHEPGKQIVSADWSQAEIKMVAHITKDKSLILALDKEDFHSYMASLMFGDIEITPEVRNRAKAGSFTIFFYGGKNGIIMGGRRFGIIISDSEAYKMIELIPKKFPSVASWHQRAKQISNSKSPMIQIPLHWGHRRGLLRGERSPQQVVNTQVQGNAALGLKESLLEIKKSNLDKYIGAIVHDEIVASGVPDNEVKDFSIELDSCMKKGMNKVCEIPMDVEITSGSFWKKD